MNGIEEVKTLICTVGLPRSGKTTWAKACSKNGCFPIVNPDSIRLALHGQRFCAFAEPFVWAIARTMVRSLFLAGHPFVILDATNTTRKRRDEWKSKEWNTMFKLIHASAYDCHARADSIGDHEIGPVIDRMQTEQEALGIDELQFLSF